MMSKPRSNVSARGSLGRLPPVTVPLTRLVAAAPLERPRCSGSVGGTNMHTNSEHFLETAISYTLLEEQLFKAINDEDLLGRRAQTAMLDADRALFIVTVLL